MPPLVSILIPCYNADKYIGEAVESALAQTHSNIEVVVVDDGSTDGSVRVLESFGDRIRWEAGPNRGGCAARNRALALSRGEYIQYLDADDMLETSKVERQLPLLASGAADIVLCKMGLKWPAPRPRAPEKKKHPAPEGDPLFYFVEYPIQTAAPLHRRDLLERVGGFNENLRRGQEYDLHLRLGALYPRLAIVDEVLVWVRMHDGERVSRRPLRAEDSLLTFGGLKATIDTQRTWTPQRREWVARRLFQAGRAMSAAGDRARGVKAQAEALALSPLADADDAGVTRCARRLLGLKRTEGLGAIWRKARAVVTPT